MSPLPESTELAQLDAASAQLIDLIVAGLQDERGVHLETAIGAAGGLAGVALLRATGIDLSSLKASSPVFVDAVNDGGQDLLNFMIAACRMAGIAPDTGWADPVPADHNPLKPVTELVGEFEQPFVALCERLSIAARLRPHVAALAAVKLTSMGKQMLSPEIGKAIALWAVVSASKTVPPAAKPS